MTFAKRGAAGYLITIILGLVVIGLMAYGLGNVGYQYAKEKIFGEKIFTTPSGEKEFVPYTGPPLKDEERIVLNSANALRCAVNSVALGEYKPDDPKVCPPPLEKTAPYLVGSSPSTLAWATVTGNAAAPKQYESATVQCSGAAPRRVKAPALEAPALRTVVQEILNCKATALDPDFAHDTRCAYLDVSDWAQGQQYDEDRVVRYMTENKMEFKGWEGAIDWLTSWDKVALQNRIEIETVDNKLRSSAQYDRTLCVDFRRGTIMNYISVNGCDSEAQEQFSCAVKEFQLPQPEAQNAGIASLFIQAYGDPRWLVYYESFPQEATAYWHKEWTDIFNVWTIGMVTVSGVLNMAGGVGGKAAKVAKTAAKEASEIAKTGVEALVKKGITEAEQALIQRLAKGGVENTMKTLLLEEALTGAGMTAQAARRISQEVVEVVGKRTGTRVFAKSKDQLEARIGKIIEEEFKDATPAFRAQLLKEIMEGGDRTVMKLGKDEIAGGLQQLIAKDLTKDLTSNIIKKRAYQQLLDSLVTKEGTLNAELLRHNGEAALKSLDAIARINPTAAQKAWAGTREILDIFALGTFGGRSGKGLFETVAAQSPIKFSTRGFVIGGTAAKTVVGLPGWVAQHSYPVMLLLAWYIDAQDALNEKYKPVGGNAIAINQPTLLGPTLPLGLNEAANDFYVTNHIKSFGYSKYGERMYFVSPCKANLNVYKRKCTCYKNPQLHKFTYPGGTVNVEPGTVTQLPDPVMDAYFRQRWEKGARQQLLENWRPQWNQLDDAAKARYANAYEQYALEQYVDMQFENYDDDFFKEIISPVGGIVRGRDGVINWLAGTSTVQGGLSARDLGERMKQKYDASHAVKRCDQSGFVKDVIGTTSTLFHSYMAGGNLFGETIDPAAEQKLRDDLLRDEYFKPDCIEIEPERTEGYCYDFYPASAWIRNTVTVASLVADAVIIGFTGGLATPLALLGTGLTAATVDVLLEANEKWP